MAEKSGIKMKHTDEDPDLDALLDDALSDFDKPPPTSQASKSAPVVDFDNDPLFESLWNDDSVLKMADGLQDVFGQMVKEDPNLMADFQKFQEENGAGSSGAFDASIMETMEELSKNMQGMSTDSDFNEMFKEFNADGDGGNFINMMQGMMGNLLSKELLYPSLKDINEKYPSWLEQNKATLSLVEYGKYKDQHCIVSKVCTIFEEENEEDSKSVKEERLTKVMHLMQQLQKYGQPPAEMLSDLSEEQPGLQSPKCTVM